MPSLIFRIIPCFETGYVAFDTIDLFLYRAHPQFGLGPRMSAPNAASRLVFSCPQRLSGYAEATTQDQQLILNVSLSSVPATFERSLLVGRNLDLVGEYKLIQQILNHAAFEI